LESRIGNGKGLSWVNDLYTLRELRTYCVSEPETMRKKPLYRRWKRKYFQGLRQISKKLERCRDTGDPEAVHQLRVALRRTRLLTLVGRAVIGRKRSFAFRTWAQGVADALSPVRDYDVMIEWTEAVCKRPELIQALHQDRQQAWNEARRGLSPMAKEDWIELRHLKSRGRRRRKLASRYRKVLSTTRDLIAVDAVSFDRLEPAARHDFRRALRRLRYLQELDAKARGRTAAEADELGRLQMVLGELQNAQAMKGLLRNGHGDSIHRHLLRYVEQHEAQWYPRCRRSLRRVVNSLSRPSK
jgi:CHAD domain-containing protein